MERFKTQWVVENGYPHCKITDTENDMEVHCDPGEIKETIRELKEVS